jgi:hypothetical protein
MESIEVITSVQGRGRGVRRKTMHPINPATGLPMTSDDYGGIDVGGTPTVRAGIRRTHGHRHHGSVAIPTSE